MPALQPFSARLRSRRVLAVSTAVITALAGLWMVSRHSVENGQLLWSNIKWRSLEANGRSYPHAVLMLDAQLPDSGIHALMQLDLGNDPTVLYHYADVAFGVKANVLHRISGTIANRSFRNESFRFMETGGKPIPRSGPVLLGSLGSSFFENRILLLDFVKQRAAILGKGLPVPDAVERGFEFLPVTRNRHGNLLLPATVNGRAAHQVAFDTGSSMFPIVTGRNNWIDWTGRRDDDARNSIIRANSWGRTAVLVGAPLTGNLCVGSACADRPLVFFESSGLQNFVFEGPSSMGAALIGNVLFDGRFTVAVDLARGRLGLYKGSFGALDN